MKPAFLYTTLLLTFVVVTVGAFVRLSDAGLGCPDWPGCYGQLIGVADESVATQQYPDSPYDLKKAWIEVGHRYIAGVLGLMIAYIAWCDFAQRQPKRRRWGVAQWLLVIVIFQALLGMLTVTEKLNPTIVTSHLLGGMLTLSLVSLLAAKSRMRQLAAPARPPNNTVSRWCAVAGVALFIQIFLGGWVSTNYAALACPSFPYCQTGWLPPVVDYGGFKLGQPLHLTDPDTAMNAAMLSTIHWVHRVGALVLSILITALAVVLFKQRFWIEGSVLLVALAGQVIIGIINVVGQLPLWAAVAHNGGAAVLLIIITHLWVRIQYGETTFQ